MHLGKSYSLFEFTLWSRRQLYASLACGSLPVVLYQFLGLKWLSIPVSVVVLLGTATSFIVGFRNVQTYGRALEAQQIWTEILNGSRSLGVMSRDFPAGPAAGRELILRHCAWLTALRYQLRSPRVWENAGKAAVAWARGVGVPCLAATWAVSGGIPTALFFVPLTAIILSGLPPEKIPAAAGLSNFVRVFCGAVGTSLATTGWNNRAVLHHARLVEQAGPGNPLYGATLNAIQSTLGFTPEQAVAYFERGLNTQAIMLGLNDIFWISGVIFAAIIPLIWFTKPGKGAVSGAAAAAH